MSFLRLATSLLLCLSVSFSINTCFAQTIVAICCTGEPGVLEKAVTIRAGGRKLASIIPNEVLIDTIAANESKLTFERTGFSDITHSCLGDESSYYYHVELKALGNRWIVTPLTSHSAHSSVVEAAQSFRASLVPKDSKQLSSNDSFAFSGQLPNVKQKIAVAMVADSSLLNMASLFKARFESAMLEAGQSLVEREEFETIINEQKLSLSGLTQGTVDVGELEDVDGLLIVRFDKVSDDFYSIQASLVDITSGAIACTWVSSGSLSELIERQIKLN